MSSQLESIYSDELILLAETLGEVKTRTEKLEGEFSTHAKPLEAATNALSAALSGIKALQFHVLDNNLGALSARVEEMRKAVDEQVGVIALELKKADETNAAKAGADAETLRFEILALESKLESLVTQFGQQLERVEFAAKEDAKKLQLIPGPAGAAGASLNPRGTFIDGEVYNRLDVVSWLGSSYIATVDGVTEKPSKNSNQWQTLASRGGGGAGGVGDFGSLAGVAQINQGGTGQTTRAAALNALLPDQAGSTQYMLLTDGSGTVSWGAQPVAGLPSQTSNSGRLLTTNGTTASWSNAVTVSGSNATVGGTLTVTGDTTGSGNFVRTGSAGNYRIFVASTGANARWAFGADNAAEGGSNAGSDFRIYSFTDAGSVLSNPVFKLTRSSGAASFSGTLAVESTTASTSASTGALVVGNGTSGGLGVGGQVSCLGFLLSGNGAPRHANTDATFYSNATSSTTMHIAGFSGGSQSADILKISLNGISEWMAVKASGQVACYATTASTSTSSGALVVSGGVGVAGAIYAGGGLAVTGGSAAAGSIFKTSTLGLVMSGATGSSYDLFVTNPAGNYIMQVPTGTRNVEFAATLTTIGNITSGAAIATSAPVGGSGSWELGVYSTTAPAATGYVTIEIGGTAYKLLASNV